MDSTTSSSSCKIHSFASYDSATLQHQPFPSQYHHHQDKTISNPRKIPNKNNNSYYSNNKKQHVSPLPPNPPRIYNVEPRNFKEVVQMLTRAPEFQPNTRLQEAAPPPLSLSPPRQAFGSGGFVEANAPLKQFDSANSFGSLLSPTLGFNLSPSTLAWCSSFLMSPGTTGPAVI